MASYFIIACSSSSDSDSSDTNIEAARYVGNWTTGCTLSQLPQASTRYFDYSFQFTATNWQFVQGVYLDEGCTLQMTGTEDTGISESGTTTIAATYIYDGTLTTTSGLQADKLVSTITAFANTLEEPGDEPIDAIGREINTLVYVSDANILFVDGGLMGLGDDPNGLILTLPFSKSE